MTNNKEMTARLFCLFGTSKEVGHNNHYHACTQNMYFSTECLEASQWCEKVTRPSVLQHYVGMTHA